MCLKGVTDHSVKDVFWVYFSAVRYEVYVAKLVGLSVRIA